MTRTEGSKRSADTTAADYAMTLRLSRPLVNRLNLAALATGSSASQIIRDALAEHLVYLEASSEHRDRYNELRAALAPAESGAA